MYKYEPRFAQLLHIYRRKAVSLCFQLNSLINLPFLKKCNSLDHQCCLCSVRTIKQETGWITEWFHTTSYYLMKKVWKEHALLTVCVWLKRDGCSKFVFVGWTETEETHSACVCGCGCGHVSSKLFHK